MRLLSLYIFTTLTSYGPASPKDVIYFDRPYVDADSTLQLLVDNFYEDASYHKRGVNKTLKTIEFTSDSLPALHADAITVGVCYFEEVREIQLQRQWWDAATPSCRRSLVYHELGHCALDLSHTPQDIKEIMQPTLYCGDDADARWHDLVFNLMVQ